MAAAKERDQRAVKKAEKQRQAAVRSSKQKIRRQLLSPADAARIAADNAAQHRAARDTLSPEDSALIAAADAAQRRAARDTLSPVDAARIAADNAAQHRAARDALSPEDCALIAADNAAQHRAARDALSPADAARIRLEDAARHDLVARATAIRARCLHRFLLKALPAARAEVRLNQLLAANVPATAIENMDARIAAARVRRDAVARGEVVPNEAISLGMLEVPTGHQIAGFERNVDQAYLLFYKKSGAHYADGSDLSRREEAVALQQPLVDDVDPTVLPPCCDDVVDVLVNGGATPAEKVAMMQAYVAATAADMTAEACAVCGVRKLNSGCRYLQLPQLHLCELSQAARLRYERTPAHWQPVWDVYQCLASGGGLHYMHPEFVRPGMACTLDACQCTVSTCDSCSKLITGANPKLPVLSVAKVHLGTPLRVVGLAPLSRLEAIVGARVRTHGILVKLNGGAQALKSSIIAFEHDAAAVVPPAVFPDIDGAIRSISVSFVGPRARVEPAMASALLCDDWAMNTTRLMQWMRMKVALDPDWADVIVSYCCSDCNSFSVLSLRVTFVGFACMF